MDSCTDDHMRQDDRARSEKFQTIATAWLANQGAQASDGTKETGEILDADCCPAPSPRCTLTTTTTLRNLIEHETVHGYRTFELWQGDITNPTFPVDVLVVSSIAGMITRSDSVVGALLRIGIDVMRMGETPECDLRDLLGVWLSHELPPEAPFRRILCLEFTFDQQRRGSSLDISDILDNVFAALALFEVKGIVEPRSMALPLLGAGGMVLDPEFVVAALIPAAKRSVERSATLGRVAFFAYRPDTADLLDEAMNAALGRSRVTLPQKQPMISGLCDSIAAELRTLGRLVSEKKRRLLDELESVLLRGDAVRSFEIGILGRRFAEVLVTDLRDGRKGRVLAHSIDALKDRGVATWITSYLHVLRHLGNESAHEATDTEQRLPAFVGESDLVVELVCIRRLIEFWIEVKQSKAPQRTKAAAQRDEKE